MKRLFLIILSLGTTCFMALQAQTERDVLRYSQTMPLGTARSTGMGGAFSAVGGDFSAGTLNPAGFGLFRRRFLFGRLFGGGFGLQHFYCGSNFKGVMCIVFSWTFVPTILGWIDGVKFLTMSDDRFERRYTDVTREELAMRSRFNKYDELERLGELHRKGVLSEDEFELAKMKLMGYAD